MVPSARALACWGLVLVLTVCSSPPQNVMPRRLRCWVSEPTDGQHLLLVSLDWLYRDTDVSTCMLTDYLRTRVRVRKGEAVVLV